MLSRGVDPAAAYPAVTVTRAVFAGGADPGRPAVLDAASGRSLSYAELTAAIRSAAQGLTREGFGPGDVVGLHLRDATAFAVALHAVIAIGAVPFPIPATPDALDLLAETNPRAIITPTGEPYGTSRPLHLDDLFATPPAHTPEAPQNTNANRPPDAAPPTDQDVPRTATDHPVTTSAQVSDPNTGTDRGAEVLPPTGRGLPTPATDRPMTTGAQPGEPSADVDRGSEAVPLTGKGVPSATTDRPVTTGAQPGGPDAAVDVGGEVALPAGPGVPSTDADRGVIAGVEFGGPGAGGDRGGEVEPSAGEGAPSAAAVRGVASGAQAGGPRPAAEVGGEVASAAGEGVPGVDVGRDVTAGAEAGGPGAGAEEVASSAGKDVSAGDGRGIASGVRGGGQGTGGEPGCAIAPGMESAPSADAGHGVASGAEAGGQGAAADRGVASGAQAGGPGVGAEVGGEVGSSAGGGVAAGGGRGAALGGEAGSQRVGGGGGRGFAVGGGSGFGEGSEVVGVEGEPDRDVALVVVGRGFGLGGRVVWLTHAEVVAGLVRVAGAGVIGGGDTVLTALPLGGVLGLNGVLNPVLRLGATVVACSGARRHELLRALRDHRVTVAVLPPGLVEALAYDRAVSRYDLGSLRAVVAAGGPLAAEDARAAASRLGCPVRQAYGLAEAAGFTHLNRRAAEEGTLDSVGRGLPGVVWCIVHPGSGAEQSSYQPGELCVRLPVARTAAVPVRWLPTGDSAFADDHGRVFVLGRLPARPEPPGEPGTVLAAHPAVGDAAVAPAPDEDLGLAPHAFVVLIEPVSEIELLAYVNGLVPPTGAVTAVHVVDEIPRAVGGQVRRRALLERAGLGP